MRVRVHAVERKSRANGPGTRTVVWFQGCTLGCPGCFNPETHDASASAPGEWRELDQLLDTIAAQPDIEGVTFSGGEPFQQPEALLELCRGLRARTELSILIFSGYTLAEIERRPLGPETLASIDVLIDGRYTQTKPLGRGLRGSSNQRIRLLTDRYTEADVSATPATEVRIAPDGSVVLTGVDPLTVD